MNMNDCLRLHYRVVLKDMDVNEHERLSNITLYGCNKGYGCK
jgi:hypothetical protein